MEPRVILRNLGEFVRSKLDQVICIRWFTTLFNNSETHSSNFTNYYRRRAREQPQTPLAVVLTRGPLLEGTRRILTNVRVELLIVGSPAQVGTQLYCCTITWQMYLNKQGIFWRISAGFRLKGFGWSC